MAPSTIPSRVLRVSPPTITTTNRGQKQANGDEIFQVSDTGLQIVPLYIWLVDVFPLPDNSAETHERVVSSLTKGLELALGDYPELTGTSHYDNDARRVVVKCAAGASAPLHVRDASNAEDQVPSWAWYHEHDYPLHRLEAAQVLPPEGQAGMMAHAADLDSPGPAVAAFQVTFIKGGVIVGSAMSHQVTDGLGWDAFFTAWAAYSKAAATGQPHGLDSDIPPQTLLTAEAKPDPEEWEALRGKFPTMKYHTEPPAAPPAPPADFVPPVVKTRVFHFPRSKLTALKAECSKGLPEGTPYISTYDAVAALWWRACLRAKRPAQPEIDAPGATTNNIHAVNMRRRLGTPLSPRYIGSAVAVPRSRDVPVPEALGPRSSALPLLAATIRANTASVTPEYCKGLIKWAAGSPDLRYNELDMPWIHGKACMGFAWHDMDVYSKHDFGFGLPSCMRWPQMAFDGFFIMFPSRAAVVDDKSHPDEGIECSFGLIEDSFERMEKDAELLEFCTQRGMGS